MKWKCLLQILILLSKKKQQHRGIERALFVVHDVLPNRPTVWSQHCYSGCNNRSWFCEFSWGSEYSSFSLDFKISSSCISNHLRCNGNCTNQVWKVLRLRHIKSDEGLFWKSRDFTVCVFQHWVIPEKIYTHPQCKALFFDPPPPPIHFDVKVKRLYFHVF